VITSRKATCRPTERSGRFTPGWGRWAAALLRDESLYAAADEAIATAGDEGRPIEPALLAPTGERREALRRAFERARRRGAGDPPVCRLARELESARASPGSGLRR
jgi:hypothetical protein